MATILSRKQLAALRGPKHWSPEDARSALVTWKASGLSRSAFCSEHGISYQRLYLWARQLGDWELPALAARRSEPASFLPVVVTPSASVATADSALAIRLPSGIVLELRDTASIDPRWLASLVSAMGHLR
jgi:hypothetical protein